MEAIGLAISVISLAGVFKDCIDLFSMISVANSLDKEFAILSVKLDIERTLLLQWAEQVRLIHQDYDRRLDSPHTRRTIAGILESIKVLLSDGSELEHRYGMQRLKIEERERFSILSAHRLRQFRYDFKKLSLDDHLSIETANELHQNQGSSRPEAEANVEPGSHKQKPTLKAKFCWAVRDKQKFSSLIQHLSELVRGLNAIVPLMQSASVELLQHDVRHVERISRLELLMDGAKEHDRLTSFAEVIQEQIDQRCQKRILDSLWYRMLDHRRNSVPEAYSGTFDWALNPPAEDVEWDNLSHWLQSGSGLYWIYGKPGSGKTTLIKYLYDNSVTRSLLSEWAKGEPLLMPQFFFWNLGTPEQKTQYGLYRGLLYYILNDNPSLIPDLLPQMWREAHNDSDPADRTALRTWAPKLSPPTEEEMVLAFPRLKAHSKTAYCFFIDGLDEYSGDPFRLIEFLEKLVSSNVKAVVSSRPIPSCFQAFSRGPKLRLQDLTRNDIKAYVHDTILLHPHREALVELDSKIVDRIKDEVTEKASGVFLWVVLACRSLIQGFAAYDSPEELLQRLNELPPEINDLFRHMLQRFDPRYYGQAAKLLRLCYHSTILRADPHHPHHALFTLGLALADADKLDITKPLKCNALSQEERISQCNSFEARLRSRCGLLEIQPGHSQLCFCQSHQLHYTEHAKSRIVDSTVEFIHRTVFEFLELPGIWDHDYLQIRDEGFYPDAVLSRVNAHLMLASIHRVLDHPDDEHHDDMKTSEFICMSLQHLQETDFKLGDKYTVIRGQLLHSALLDTARILRLLTLTTKKEAPLSSSRLSDYLKLHFRTSKNGLPDLVAKLVCNLGMQTTLQHMDISRYGDQSSPLLYHAIEQPILPYLDFEIEGLPCSYSIITNLVESGCDVNEVLVDPFYEEETTPWIHWLDQSPIGYYEAALLDSWLAEEFLAAGADVVGAADRFKTPITILVARRILGDALEEDSIDDEDGGFSKSHRLSEQDLSGEQNLRLAYERIRTMLRDSARQVEEIVDNDLIREASQGERCGEESRIKRCHEEAIQDDKTEDIHSSGVDEHQTRRQRTSAVLDVEMGM